MALSTVHRDIYMENNFTAIPQTNFYRVELVYQYCFEDLLITSNLSGLLYLDFY